MRLLRRDGSLNGKTIGVFLCPKCKETTRKSISDGRRAKSCGINCKDRQHGKKATAKDDHESKVTAPWLKTISIKL